MAPEPVTDPHGGATADLPPATFATRLAAYRQAAAAIDALDAIADALPPAPFDADAFLARWAAAGGHYGCSGGPMLAATMQPGDDGKRLARLDALHDELATPAARAAVKAAICPRTADPAAPCPTFTGSPPGRAFACAMAHLGGVQ